MLTGNIAGEAAGRQLVWLLGGAIALTALAEFCRRLLTEALGLDYARDVRLALFERLLRRPTRDGRTRSRGSQLLPFVGDLTALRQWWSDGIARGSSSLLIVIGVIGWLFRIDSVLGWWMAGLTVVILAGMAAIAGPYFQATRRQRATRGVLTALISDRIGAAHSVMAMGGLQRELSQTSSRIDRMNRASMQRARWSGAMRGMVAAFPMAAALVLLHLAGGGERSNGIAVHEIAGLLTLSGMLGGSVADIGRAIELAIPAQIAGRRLKARLAEITPITADAKDVAERKRAILSLSGLALAARAGGFSTTVGKGEIIAVDGLHAGLLIEVLAGMQSPMQGQARISGRPAAGLGQRQRRQWQGIATLWVPVLQDSLAANLLFRMRRGAGDVQLPRLMQALGLAHLLDAEGQVSERRLRDEGGALEPRDLAAVRLVRALIGQPRLLLIDRATPDLDAAQIAGLVQLLRDWPGVVVIAAERAELRALATRCWTVAGGAIHETGVNSNVVAVHPLHPVREA